LFPEVAPVVVVVTVPTDRLADVSAEFAAEADRPIMLGTITLDQDEATYPIELKLSPLLRLQITD
jgi:hypothetical protein